MHLSTLKTLYHSYIYLKCIFWHSRHCTIHILCVNYCMLSLIFRHSRHCTIHISIWNASFDTQDIVPFIYLLQMHLSTLKTLYHSYIYLKCIFWHSRHCTIHILCVNYCMLSLIFRHSRHCTIHISISNASFNTQDIVPFIYLFKMHLLTLKTLYHSYIYLKCIFWHSRHCTIRISIKNVLKILKTIVLYAVFDLSTLTTWNQCKLCVNYCMLCLIFWHSRHEQ